MTEQENIRNNNPTLREEVLSKLQEAGLDESYLNATLVIAQYLLTKLTEKDLKKITEPNK